MSFERKYVIVFDTSTLVSAAIRPQSAPAQALLCAIQLGELVVSGDTLGELKDVLLRERFDRYQARLQREAFVQDYADGVRVVHEVAPVQACRDTKDDKFLALAVAASAKFIVPSDDDLLVLESFQGTRILSPRQFLDLHLRR